MLAGKTVKASPRAPDLVEKRIRRRGTRTNSDLKTNESPAFICVPLWLKLGFSAYCLAASACFAQDFTQRGFLENTTYLYPQTARSDSGLAVSGAVLRYEAFYKISRSLRVSAGVDARTDTHRQTERSIILDWRDGKAKQPAIAVRRLSATYSQGKLTVEAGKQFIRWGKADILNPTDRFAPQDYLNVVQSDFLPITAARLTYGTQANTMDAVWCPTFTPSRMPLIGQRWVVLPENLPIRDLGSNFPGGSQYGVRWNHIGKAAEYSISFFDGFNHLPLIDTSIQLLTPVEVSFRRLYPKIRTYGGDLALPLRWVSLKSEAPYFTSPDTRADEYILYVVQLERQAGGGFLWVGTREST